MMTVAVVLLACSLAVLLSLLIFAILARLKQ